jgi:hypothetical protein
MRRTDQRLAASDMLIVCLLVQNVAIRKRRCLWCHLEVALDVHAYNSPPAQLTITFLVYPYLRAPAGVAWDLSHVGCASCVLSRMSVLPSQICSTLGSRCYNEVMVMGSGPLRTQHSVHQARRANGRAPFSAPQRSHAAGERSGCVGHLMLCFCWVAEGA